MQRLVVNILEVDISLDSCCQKKEKKVIGKIFVIKMLPFLCATTHLQAETRVIHAENSPYHGCDIFYILLMRTILTKFDTDNLSLLACCVVF